MSDALDRIEAACSNLDGYVYSEYDVSKRMYEQQIAKIRTAVAELRAERAELESVNRKARVQIPLWKGIANSMVARAKRIKCQFGGDHSMADCKCDPHQLGDAVSSMQDELDKGHILVAERDQLRAQLAEATAALKLAKHWGIHSWACELHRSMDCTDCNCWISEVTAVLAKLEAK